MPVLSENADMLAGGGGQQGSYNGVYIPFPTYGGGCWLDLVTALLSVPAPAPDLARLVTWVPGTPAPTDLAIGANEFVARAGRWMAWRDGYGVYGSLGHIPIAGLAGPHSIANDGTICYVPNRQQGGCVMVTPNGEQILLPGVVFYSLQCLGAGKAIWQGGAYGRPAPRPALANAQGILITTLSDGDWLTYWSDGVGQVAQLDGAHDGYILGTTPTFFNFWPEEVNDQLVVAWSTTQGEALGDLRKLTVDRTQPRTPLAPLVPPDQKPVGPLGPPVAADDTEYDIPTFLTTDPALQPRKGPSHPQHQTQPDAHGTFYVIKFGDIIPTGRSYEMYTLDDGGYRHREDASGSTPMHFTDTRWWPRKMKIGEDHAFITGPHESVWDERDPCKETHRDPVNRKMWLHAVYPKWHWGPDLGTRRTIVLAYDNTAGFELPGRFVELGIFAENAGWCRWEAYKAELVYPNGPDGGAVFPDSARSDRKDFYLVGPPFMTPELTGCVDPLTVTGLPWASPPKTGFLVPQIYRPGR